MRGAMDHSRLQRLLRLITMLQSGGGHTAATLMATMNISRRTLFRDLQALRDAGIPLVHRARDGYRLDKQAYLPPVHLTVPETLGLMLLAKQAAGHRHRPLASSALSAVYKLVTSVPEPIRSACSEMMSSISINPGASLQGDAESKHYTTLQPCVDSQRACRFVYQGPLDDQPFEGVLHPYALHFSNRAWYLFAWSQVHDQVRMFKLIRFHLLEPLEQKFHRPADFRAADQLGHAWQLIPEGREYHVELEFTPRVATNVSEVLWHPTQQQKILKDGRCVMRFTVDGLDEIAWWICGYADQVIVRKPATLRDKVKQMLKAAAGRYG